LSAGWRNGLAEKEGKGSKQQNKRQLNHRLMKRKTFCAKHFWAFLIFTVSIMSMLLKVTTLWVAGDPLLLPYSLHIAVLIAYSRDRVRKRFSQA